MITKIKDKYYTIERFLKNIWTFRSFLSEYRWHDHSYLELGLQEILKDMANKHKKCGQLVKSEEKSKEIYKFYKMLKQLRGSEQYISTYNYFPREGQLFGDFEKKSHIPFSYEHISDAREFKELEDRKIFYKMLVRRMGTWYD